MPLIKKRKVKQKTASMEQFDSPEIKRLKPSRYVASSPVTSPLPSEVLVRRSGRKRTLKQFHDFEVELPQNEKFNRLDEQEGSVDELESIEAEHEVKIEQPSSEIEDNIGIYSKTKQIYKQACTYLNRKEIAPDEMYHATSQKRKRNFVKGESEMNLNKQEVSYDLSLTLKRLGKIGGILYKCGTLSCVKTFLTLKRLDQHKKLIHKENVRHVCTECNKHFGTFFMFRSHIRMEHSDLASLPYIIKNADIVFKDKENKVGGKILVCTKCGYRYGQKENPDHVCQPMELRYYCPCCDYESFVDEEMQNHLSENHEGELQESKHIERYVELRSSAKEPGWSITPNDRTCEICDIKFESNAKLKLHLNNMHANHPFACGLCKLCYGRKTAVKKHMTTHRRTDLKCDVCKKEFYEKQRLAVHMLTHTGERPHQCEICGNRYCDEKAVRKHILVKHTDPSDTSSAQTSKPKGRSAIESASICHQCGKSFSNVTLLNKHMKVHRKKKTYKCPDCDLAFNEITALKQHKLSHKTLDFSQIGDKTLTNESLNEIFKEIKVYEENHPSGKPFKCGICEKRFDKQQFVHRHIRVIHMKEEDKTFVCGICKRGFTLSAALRTHMRLHSNAKPYKCRLCDKQFRQLGHVKDHLLHHGKAQLQCKICKKMFKSRGSLRRHVMIHCKTHPYQCPIEDCTGAFLSLFPFLEHLSTCLVSVDASTLLECNFCLEKFSKDNITSHYHHHEHDVRFPCELCRMSFGNYQALYFHKEKCNHFLDSEFEAPGNTKTAKRMKASDAATHWSNEELMSLYDYVEEDAEAAVDALRQENNDNSVYDEQSKMNVNMDNDGELILIAEQLTYMASGFPYREVIVQTTENDGDGTLTEITIEDVDDRQIVEQNGNGQSIEYAEQVAGEENVLDNGVQSGIEKQYHQVSGGQYFEELHGKSDEQVNVGQILRTIIAEETMNQVDDEQTNEQVDAEQNDKTASDSQVSVGRNENVKEPDQHNGSTFEDGSSANLNNSQESYESTRELKKEGHINQTPEKQQQLSGPDTTCTQPENIKSNPLPSNSNIIQEHSKDMCGKSNNVLQADSVDTNKHDDTSEQMCSVCKCLFPDATALSEHYCVESSVSDIMSNTESEVETRNKKKQFKRRRKLTKRPKKSIMINSLSLLLREMYRKNAVEYICTTGACGIIFNNINKLSNHKKQVHSENMKYMCSECQKQFGSFYVYKSHIRMEHSTQTSVRFQVKGTKIMIKGKKYTLVGEILVCTKCGYRYGGHDDFKHDCGPRELLYYCPCCTYASEDVSQIGEHISDTHPGEFKSLEVTDRYAHLRSANREPGLHISHRAKTCDDCNITFNSNEQLKQHLNTKHAAHPFACGICKTCYGRKSALQKHMLSHRHLDLKCDVCQKEFSYKSRLDIHKMIHTGNKPHSCQVCGNRYCDEKSLQKHMMIKHVEEFKKKYPNKAMKANVSKKTVSNTPSMCHYCGKSFSTNIQLKRHFREHRKEEMFKCPHCQLMFEDIVVFKKHKSTHQTLELSGAGNLKNMSTADMNAIFKEIKVHEDGHPSGKPYKCGICEKRFDKQQFVHRHIRVIHMKEEDKSFVCNICKRGFTLSAALRTHMRLHSNAKPYKCRLCDKQFRQLGHVKDHLLHHGKAQLQCKICKKMFKSKGNLRRHVQIHCKILPFQCPVNKCTAAYHSLYSFLAHCTECFKSVASKATLRCNFCSKAFSASEILQHYHSHENDLDFPCQTCGKSFVTYQRLYFHKEEKHHFDESELETPSHCVDVETRSDKQTVDEDNKPDLSQEELLQQYDYILEEDCTIPKLDSTETEGIDTAALQKEASDKLPTDVQVEHEVADIIVNQLNQEEIILTADQLSELTSGVVYQEVVVEEDQTGVVNEGAVMVDTGDVMDMGTSQHFINSEGTHSEVFTVTDPATEEVTYYIIPLDQTAS